MKMSKYILTRLGLFACPAVFALTLCFLSCASTGTLAQIGANIGQSTGVINERTADAIIRSGAAIGAAFEEINPEQEYFIGRAVAANILGTYRIQNQPSLAAYLNRICNALIINSPRPEIFNGYHVNILDSEEINAFSTPGGHILITRGLIDCAVSEDTLAAVLAHEIAHIQLQHGLKAIKNSRINNALVVTGTSAAGAALDMPELQSIFNESVNEIITTMMNNGYSQTQEFEADTMAMDLLALAGYEPSSLLDMLRSLERNQSGQRGGFNRTHPTPAQRITNAQKTAGSYNIADTRSFRRTRYEAIF